MTTSCPPRSRLSFGQILRPRTKALAPRIAVPAPAIANTPQQRIRAIWINAALWTFQGWLTMFFVAAGFAKLTEPMNHLIVLLGWPEVASETFVRAFGAAELALAALMLVPLAGWKIGRPVVIIGAAALILIQLGFLATHLARIEIGLAVMNLLLLGITVPVFFGRRRGF